MRDFLNGLIEMGHSDPNTNKELIKFCKKLDSFSHAPLNKKHMERMAPFAKNPLLLEQVNTYLLHYFKAQNNFQAAESYNPSYEVVPVCYSLSLLLQAPSVMSSVETMVRAMIETKHADLNLLRRFFSLYPTVIYRELSESIEKYYLEVNQQVEAYIWAAKIGLELPNVYDWEFTFRLKPLEDISNTQSKDFLLKVSVFAPKGDGKCFDIELRKRTPHIYHSWNDFSDDYKIRIPNQNSVVLKNKPSLLTFKAFLNEIEVAYGCSFDKNFDFSYFSKGIKKKIKYRSGC